MSNSRTIAVTTVLFGAVTTTARRRQPSGCSRATPATRLPRVYCYFDDIAGPEIACMNEYMGELEADPCQSGPAGAARRQNSR